MAQGFYVLQSASPHPLGIGVCSWNTKAMPKARQMMDAIRQMRAKPHNAYYWEPPDANVPTGCVTPGRTFSGKQFVPMTLCAEYPNLGRWLIWLEKYDGSWKRDNLSDCFVGPDYTDREVEFGPMPLTFCR